MDHAARALAPLTPGCTVAERYVVRRVLGQGGMGQVLEVEHMALGRPFALKVLRLEKWNEELVRRFNREARALAKVTSARVAQVTDFGVDAQVGPYYVMELLEGETLEQRLERDGIVAAQDALAICAELCESLSEVHAAGIVHRDLKPSNVGLPRAGPVGVKLLDFGLAASMDDAFLSKITQSNQILGSLPYMAPEQFGACDPSAAMDIYAVGVVLYESMTGRLPFVAPSTAALIHQILATPPPPLPSELASLGPLDGLLERFLAKEPERRFASAAAAGQALRDTSLALFGGVRTKSAHPPTRSVRPGLLPPTSEAAAVDLSSIGFLPTAAMPEVDPAQVAESGTRLSAQTAMPGQESWPQQPATSSGGTRLVTAAIVGVVFAILAAVGVVVLLSAIDATREQVVSPPPIAPAPTVPPAAPVPAAIPPGIEPPVEAPPTAPPVRAVADPEPPEPAVERQPIEREPIEREPIEREPIEPEPAPRPRAREPRDPAPSVLPYPSVQRTAPAPRQWNGQEPVRSF